MRGHISPTFRRSFGRCYDLVDRVKTTRICQFVVNDEKFIGGIERREIRLAEYDSSWPKQYRRHADTIVGALGKALVSIEHVGSTSVPDLAAKPIIDIVVVVEDSSDEASYLPALMQAGYQLRIREPEWYEHRMLRTPELDVHVHVFSEECSEVSRMLAFRDRLRESAQDRRHYESVKRRLAAMNWPTMQDYADAKSDVVESILSGRP
jgi:GrpB-like predicted nucleotidyltransferase (UPF0157 family)